MTENKRPKSLAEEVISILKQNESLHLTVDNIVNRLKQKIDYSRMKNDVLKPQVKQIVDAEKKKYLQIKEEQEKDLLGKKRELSNLNSSNKALLPDEKLLDEFIFTPKIKMSELGGFKLQKEIINEKIGMALENWDLLMTLNTGYIKSFLISGPPGCGKTTFAQAIGAEYGINFYQLIGPQIVSSLSGESESKIRRLFNKIKDLNKPAILFIDEIDTILGRREGGSKEMESRIVAQLKSCIESLNTISINSLTNQYPPPIFIIGATNRPEHIETSLRRSGIFDFELEFGYPKADERKEILSKMLDRVKIDIDESNLNLLSEETSGYVACDLNALIKQSGMIAVKRITSSSSYQEANKHNNYFLKCITECSSLNNCELETFKSLNDDEIKEEAENMELKSVKTNDDKLEIQNEIEKFNTSIQEEGNKILPSDLFDSLKQVQPNTLREGFSIIPNVTWNDIGGLKCLKEALNLHIVKPIKNPSLFKLMNMHTAGGVLLYGPPGCGKTLLAKAVSNAANANFISVKGPELLNKYVGESEKAVRELFKKARNSQPCVIFFDEFDALAPKRSSDNNAASDRVVNQLLTVMDGVEERQQVFLIAATNRPDMIDDAMLREGRLGTKLYVPLPDENDRENILITLIRGVGFEYDLKEMSQKTDNYSGADLAGLVREAKLNYLKRKTDIECLSLKQEEIIITKDDIELSLKNIKPSVNKKDIALYNNYQFLFKNN